MQGSQAKMWGVGEGKDYNKKQKAMYTPGSHICNFIKNVFLYIKG